MPDEPNKEMDRLLRDYAQARRKSADVSLHPATRKVLQAEVKRAYPRSAAGLWSRFRSFWPQISVATGLCAVLVIAVLSLRQRPASEEKVASTAAARPESVADNAMPNLKAREQLETPPAATGQEKQIGELSNPQFRRDGAARSEATAPPQAVAEGHSLELIEDPRLDAAKKKETDLRLFAGKDAPGQKAVSPSFDFLSKETRSQASVRQVAAGLSEPPASTNALPPVRLSRANELTNLGAAIRVRFVEVPDRARRDSPASVLTSFQMEQFGDDLRLVDKDGSIYAGQLFQPRDSSTQEESIQPVATRTNSNALALPGFSQNTAISFFRVQGTNRTLSKPVMVEGRYWERTNPAPSPERTFSFATNAPASTPSPAAASVRPKRAIIGKAVIGGTNEIPVRAVSVETW